MRTILSLFFLVLFLNNSFAQNSDTLTVGDAIEIALKNNYSIIISRADVEISKNNASLGNAGMLPQVDFNSSTSLASYDTKQRLSDNTETYKKGAPSSLIAAGVILNWTLFDGAKMFATYNKLQETSNLSQEQLKLKIESTVDSIMIKYYFIVKQQLLLAAFEKNMKIYEERIRIAETKWKLNSVPKNDYLQAKAEMNMQSAEYLRQKNKMNSLKIGMNILLARLSETQFMVTDSIPLIYNPNYEDLKKSVIINNHQVLMQQKNIEINKYALREVYALRYPKISLNSSYNFSQNQAQAVFIQLNQTLGFNAGLTASWNLYSAGNVNRQIHNLKINQEQSNFQLASIKATVEASLLRTYFSFLTAKEILALTEENYKVAEENMNAMMERFKIGNCISLELMQAQQTFEQAQVQLIEAKFDLKVAEIELMRLNGELVKL